MSRALLVAAFTAAFASHPAVAIQLPPDIVVATDGSGNFKTIAAAVASVPTTNRERIVILIKDGVYHEKFRVDAPFITLRGQSRSGTQIEFPQLNDDFTKNPDDIGRAVINLSGSANDFVLENLTAQNTAGVVGPHAFTVYGKADRTVIVNCDVLSDGADTVSLWLQDRGRYYHANCRFQGSVDFVCPRGWCYVTNCTFYEMKKGSAAVWHDGREERDMKFVLRNCQFDGVPGWVLARHHVDAQFYFLNCTFSETLEDKPVARVIYPDNPSRNAELDPVNRWGERCYFYDCKREGGNFSWLTNNLSAAAGSPSPDDITPAWTFNGKWNPERTKGPGIQRIIPGKETVAIAFSEPVTVKGKPQLKLKSGRTAAYLSGSGTDTLQFSAGEDRAEVESIDLNGGWILASEADARLVPAELKLP